MPWWVGRAWRRWRAKARLFAPVWTYRPDVIFLPSIMDPELQAVERAGGPVLQPYEGMAATWDEYNATQLPDYTAFLTHLSGGRGTWYRSVLDLACGTGILTRRLNRVAQEVVGLDASERMLDLARASHGGVPGLSFVRGDFRLFSLDRQFDAVVCACNSLNYLADPDELAQILAAVARHLRPGGVFVFDVTTEWGMKCSSGQYLHVLTGPKRVAIHFAYDRVRRRETSHAIMRSGIETHRRVPLGRADVAAAVKGTGLVVEDYFPLSFGLLDMDTDHGMLFFVLRKTG
jgi:SAM-dependent methyltransferase